MKVLVILCLFVLGAISAPERDGDIYDKFDVMKILQDDNLRNKAVGCLMDRVPCDEFQSVREKGPRIIKTRCGDCTPKQKAAFDESMKIMKEKYSDEYKEVMDKYA